MKFFLALEALLLTLALVTTQEMPHTEESQLIIRLSVGSTGREAMNRRYNPDGYPATKTEPPTTAEWRLSLTIRPACSMLPIARPKRQLQSRETADR